MIINKCKSSNLGGLEPWFDPETNPVHILVFWINFYWIVVTFINLQVIYRCFCITKFKVSATDTLLLTDGEIYRTWFLQKIFYLNLYCYCLFFLSPLFTAFVSRKKFHLFHLLSFYPIKTNVFRIHKWDHQKPILNTQISVLNAKVSIKSN
jgi:hypothetical protein